MSALRVQRFMMGTLLLISLVLMHTGQKWGEYIIWFIIAMLYISAFTGFCPSDTILGKILGKKPGDETCNR